METDKQKLRKKILAERLAMDKMDVAEKGRIITERLTDSVNWKQIKKMHVYTALTPLNEIDTTRLHDYLDENWPDVIVSTSPARKDAPMPTRQFDLIVVPVLGFDKNNYRLGMGGGWYDRFLARQKNVKTVGLAYSDALIPDLPHEAHDIPLESVITEAS